MSGRILNWLSNTVLVVLGVLILAPFLWLFITSVVPKDRALKVISHLSRQKEHAWVIGEIVKGEGVTIQ